MTVRDLIQELSKFEPYTQVMVRDIEEHKSYPIFEVKNSGEYSIPTPELLIDSEDE